MKRIPIFLEEPSNKRTKKCVKYCKRCGCLYQPMSNVSVYCSDCRELVGREKALESYYRRGQVQSSAKNWKQIDGKRQYVKSGYNQKGTNNNNYRNGDGMDNFSKAVELYGKKCNRCGSVENLLLHHRDGNHYNNTTPDNWEILCKRCHQNHHSHRDETNGRFISIKG